MSRCIARLCHAWMCICEGTELPRSQSRAPYARAHISRSRHQYDFDTLCTYPSGSLAPHGGQRGTHKCASPRSRLSSYVCVDESLYVVIGQETCMCTVVYSRVHVLGNFLFFLMFYNVSWIFLIKTTWIRVNMAREEWILFVMWM